MMEIAMLSPERISDPVPLSAAGRGGLSWPPVVNAVLINGVLIHMFGVGLPASLFARWSR